MNHRFSVFSVFSVFSMFSMFSILREQIRIGPVRIPDWHRPLPWIVSVRRVTLPLQPSHRHTASQWCFLSRQTTFYPGALLWRRDFYARRSDPRKIAQPIALRMASISAR